MVKNSGEAELCERVDTFLNWHSRASFVFVQLALRLPKKRSTNLNHQSQQLRNLKPMQKLVGEWEGTKTSPEGEEKVTASYRLTSGGTAVMETLFDGAPHEMLSVYHEDKGALVMTHYCMIGNQPKLKLSQSDSKDVLNFEYVDGANIKSEAEPRMGQMKLTFLETDKIRHDWTLYQDGKPKMTTTIELTRKK